MIERSMRTQNFLFLFSFILLACQEGMRADNFGGEDFVPDKDQELKAIPVATPSPPANFEEENAEPDAPIPPTIEFFWMSLVDGEATVSADEVMLRIRNVGESAFSASIFYTVDGGGQIAHHGKMADLELAPSETSELTLDLASCGISLDDLPYSGRAHVSATLEVEGGSPVRSAVSAPVFFHPAGDDTVILYNETVLRDLYHHGDFRALHTTEELSEEGVVLDRISFGGAGIVSDQPIGVDP